MFKNLAKKALLIGFWTMCSFSCLLLQANEEPTSADKQLPISQDKKHVCLTMIVKNESQIIERCLNSVKDVVDCMTICDTGSTDDTVAIIESFMEKNKIPGKVYHHKWENFGRNRTLSVEAAQEYLKGTNYPVHHTYLLLLDADMLLEIEPSFDKKALADDMYLMKQKSPEYSFYNARLIRASLPWESVGLTHEYWRCKVPSSQNQLTALQINDLGDGGCKADKFERDIKFLNQGLQEEPENVRYMFYLAQSYKNTRQYADAIRWFKTRIEKGDWKEEVWYSKLLIGDCYQEMGFWDQAMHWYLEAYQYNPNRAEPLLQIATYYRLTGQNDLAYFFAKQGARIPYPKDQLLFVSHPVYDYKFDEEIAISAYYTPFKEEGLAAANRLVLNKNVPSAYKGQAYKNLLFYLSNLKNATFQAITFDLPLIREGSDLRYQAMNPSIQKTEDGYDVVCRAVNYTQNKGLSYKSIDPSDETIRSRNFLLHYDRDFKLVSQKEIVENLPRQKYPSRIVGLEEPRLINHDQNKWFLSTTYDTQSEKVEQSLCKLVDQPTGDHIEVEKLIPLKATVENICEKNWLPFMKDGNFYAIYSYDPFIVYKINQENGTCETVVNKKFASDFSHFRGSAAPIEFDGGYLLMIHEMTFDEGRYYQHRFVYLDQNLDIKKISKPFTFLHKGIEYCAGMTLDHSGENCIITIGYEDAQAYLGSVDLNTIRSLLEPIP